MFSECCVLRVIRCSVTLTVVLHLSGVFGVLSCTCLSVLRDIYCSFAVICVCCVLRVFGASCSYTLVLRCFRCAVLLVFFGAFCQYL